MADPTTMTEAEFEELMQAIDAFHQATYESNKIHGEGFMVHSKMINFILYFLGGMTLFNVILFITLVSRGVI
jgi:hypothetical protein